VNFKAIQWSKALGFIAGGGLTMVFALGGPKLTAIGPVVIAVAALLNTIIPSPSQTQNQNVKVIGPSGSPTGATAVTTDSTLPISAPQKGA
jgi:hypothetical protein